MIQNAGFYICLAKSHGAGGKNAIGAAIQKRLRISGALGVSQLTDDLFIAGQLNIPA